jgi:uncharacterized protein (DUF362 family)
MKRREFLKKASLVAGTAVVAPCLLACGAPKETGGTHSVPPTPIAMETAEGTEVPAATQARPTLTPTPERRRKMTQVAFVKTSDRAEGVGRAIEMLELDPVAGMDLFVKPNFNSADPAPGSTHADTLAALVRRLQSMGAARVAIGDRSGMGNTRSTMEAKDIFRMGDELGFGTVVFDELDESGWEAADVAGSHWKQGFAVARPILDADGVVQTCCLKTHQYGGHFTMSLKNSVGLVAKQVPGERHNYMTELHTSRHQREMIAEINAAYSPSLVVLDGVEAFVTRGPAKGKRVQPNVVLAGTDRVAIDAVGIAILRYFGTTKAVSDGPIFDQAQIARAAELGLGVGSPAEIELVTDDAESAAFGAEIRRVLDQG